MDFQGSSSSDMFDAHGFDKFMMAGSSSEEDMLGKQLPVKKPQVQQPPKQIQPAQAQPVFDFTKLAQGGGDVYDFQMDFSNIKAPAKVPYQPQKHIDRKSSLKDSSTAPAQKKGVRFDESVDESVEKPQLPKEKLPVDVKELMSGFSSSEDDYDDSESASQSQSQSEEKISALAAFQSMQWSNAKADVLSSESESPYESVSVDQTPSKSGSAYQSMESHTPGHLKESSEGTSSASKFQSPGTQMTDEDYSQQFESVESHGYSSEMFEKSRSSRASISKQSFSHSSQLQPKPPSRMSKTESGSVYSSQGGREEVEVLSSRGQQSPSSPRKSFTHYTIPYPSLQNVQSTPEYIQLQHEVIYLRKRIEDTEANLSQKQDEIYKIHKQEILKTLNVIDQDEVENLKAKVLQQAHVIDLYKIEVEELVKQLEYSKVRIKDLETEAKAVRKEADRTLQFAEERVQIQEASYKERYEREAQRVISQEKIEFERKLKLLEDEVREYQTKTEELIDQNLMLKEQYSDQMHLEAKYHQAVSQLEGMKEDMANRQKVDNKVNDDYVMQEQLIQGFQKENERLMTQMRNLQEQVKQEKILVNRERERVEALRVNLINEHGGVLIKESITDTNSISDLAGAQIISKQELDQAKKTIQTLQRQLIQVRDHYGERENDLQVQIQELRKYKDRAESDVIVPLQRDYELQMSEMVRKNKQEQAKIQQDFTDELQKLQNRLTWYIQNQEQMQEKDNVIITKNREIEEIQGRLQKALEDRVEQKRRIQAEQRCQSLEKELEISQREAKKSVDLQLKNAQLEEELNQRSLELSQLLEQYQTETDSYKKRLESLQQSSKVVKASQQFEKVRQSVRTNAKPVQQQEPASHDSDLGVDVINLLTSAMGGI